MAETFAPASYAFEAAVAADLEPDGRYAVGIDAGYTIGDKPNGGYLLALLAQAVGHALTSSGTSHPDPLASTAHYLRSPEVGPAHVEVEVLRSGRSASQARAVLVQGDRRCVDATFTMGRLPAPGEGTGTVWSSVAPVEVAPIEACHRASPTAPGARFAVPILEKFDLRLDPSVLGFAVGQPTGLGEMKGWLSWDDGQPIDPLALLTFLDPVPPPSMNIGPSAWVPTLSLTAYVRALPAPGPLRYRIWAQQVADARFDEVCELWDADGTLVAHATQLAAVRFDTAGIVPFPS